MLPLDCYTIDYGIAIFLVIVPLNVFQ